MSTEEIRFSDLNGSSGSRAELTPASKQKKGVFISVVSLLIIVLFALAIAVGVGLIVYFSTARTATIQCNCGDGVNSPPTQPQWAWCEKEAANRDSCIMKGACPTEPTTVSPGGPPTTKAPLPDVRLPLDVLPEHYELELKPDIYGNDPDKFMFSGKVTITIKCEKVTRSIKIHAADLEITKDQVKVEKSDGTPLTITNQSTDGVRKFYVIDLASDLEVGKTYKVIFGAFTGKLEDDLIGLYRSSYTVGNETRWLATTQMQPTDARKTFPCFDEPGIKANFTTTLVRKSHMISISNMPIEANTTAPDGWIYDHYQTTVKMSTYLLAFVVCDFKYVEKTTSRGTKFRIYARPDAVDAGQANYALDRGAEILEYFEDYFQISFPLPKQDMIAVPDFAAGAMENWGLIIYRETALLYDDKESSTGNKQRVAVVVSHELAHQWFGNLVTPGWWDDLWLNEGFASYVEYLGVNYSHPDWKMDEQIVTEDVQDVMTIDGLASSHPIYIPVSHPSEINEIFDKISYAKGASIIRMMNSFLGEETFRMGLTNYLNNRAYDAAHHNDLWQALTQQATADGKSINVKEVMDTWVLQMGYPVVTLTRQTDPTKVSVTQKHFLIDPTQTPVFESNFNYKWMVPLTYLDETSSGTATSWTSPDIMWMKKGDITITVPQDKWLLANVGQFGYYRVNYDNENWVKLINQLNTDHLVIKDVRNRAQIIDDAFNLGRSGDLDQLTGLQVIEYLGKEKEYIAWESAVNNLAYVSKMLRQSSGFGAYQRFLLDKVSGLYNDLGWSHDTNDPHLEKYLRILALSLACGMGHAGCRNNASQLFSQWMNNPSTNPTHPDLRSIVYCNAIRNGGEKEWNFAYNRYTTETLASEKIRLLYSLSCTNEVWLMSRYLSAALDDTQIRKQDAGYVFTYVGSNSIGKTMLWDFFRENWDTIFDRHGSSIFTLNRIVSDSTRDFNTQFMLTQLEEFIAAHPNQGSAKRAFLQAVEQTKNNIKWMEKNEKTLSDWLNQKAPSP